MDNGTNVVNDLHIAHSQTVLINYEFDPLEFNSPIGQVVQSKGDEAPRGSRMDDLGYAPYNNRCWEIPN
jgi:hypothetical protein